MAELLENISIGADFVAQSHFLRFGIETTVFDCGSNPKRGRVGQFLVSRPEAFDHLWEA